MNYFEIHIGCGGEVRLVDEAWRCSRCHRICATHETFVPKKRGGRPRKPR